ncbi:hypothetical protein Pelo_2678 [Pelomyxa schiedti]|nr:hypothetical protein Pelo_2678 [Pelomyxa schiedti]
MLDFLQGDFLNKDSPLANWLEGIRLLRIGVEKGHGCLLELGWCAQDKKETFRLFKASSDQGLGAAQYSVALAHYSYSVMNRCGIVKASQWREEELQKTKRREALEMGGRSGDRRAHIATPSASPIGYKLLWLPVPSVLPQLMIQPSYNSYKSFRSWIADDYVAGRLGELFLSSKWSRISDICEIVSPRILDSTTFNMPYIFD